MCFVAHLPALTVLSNYLGQFSVCATGWYAIELDTAHGGVCCIDYPRITKKLQE